MEDEEPKRERTQQSEWNRSLDKIMRMNEIEGGVMNLMMQLGGDDGHALIDAYLNGVENLFMLFEGVCKVEEKKAFYTKRDELRKMGQEINLRSRAWYGQRRNLREGNFKIQTKEYDELRDILKYVFKCQQKHGLGIKTSTHTTFREQEENVMGVG